MQALMDTREDQFVWVDWLIAERKKRGLSQADLSRLTGLTRTAISDYEKRERPNPSIDALMKISEALGYPPEYLPRIAKILPDRAEQLSDEIQQIVYESEKLSRDDQNEVVAFIRMLNNLRKKKK